LVSYYQSLAFSSLLETNVPNQEKSPLSDSLLKEIEKGITECVDEKGFLTYRGILLLYMAGEMQIETLVPQMVDLFRNEEEGDVALNELADVY
jgi:hypothetical protein